MRAAVLVGKERFEVQSHPLPGPGDGEILIKVEGCGVCGTDAHVYRHDPFGLIPTILGHEGSGAVVKMGKNVVRDSAGKPVKVGDKVVTCMALGDDPDVYGLLPLKTQKDTRGFNGWFADYLLLRAGAGFFVVNDFSLDLRLLVEPSAVVIHAVERAKATDLLHLSSRVMVQGCGPIGLLLIAVLRTMGTESIVAMDTEDSRLAFAKELGAAETFNVHHRSLAVKPVDFAFQCTGSAAVHSAVWKFVRRGGGFCELGFFADNGDATINPHFGISHKEITAVGSWVYNLRDYAATFDFLRRAKASALPLERLITHRYPLEQINEALKMSLSMQGLKVAIIN